MKYKFICCFKLFVDMVKNSIRDFVYDVDGYCTREIKMRIAIAKEAFNRKISLLSSKPNIELKKKLVRCYVWSIVLCGSMIWKL